MSRVVLTAKDFVSIRARILSDECETCAVLFGRAARLSGKVVRIVVRDVVWPDHGDYERRSTIQAVLRPEFVARVVQRARRTGESLIFAHSHPFRSERFSDVDDRGELVLNEFLERRTPGTAHAALLFTPDLTIARSLGHKIDYSVAAVGASIIWGDTPIGSDEKHEQYDRQQRVFGSAGQTRLQNLRVGIVGVGGTGSIVGEQLAHLGVRNFLLLDPDTVEVSNLNRLVGSAASDRGRQKVDVAADMIRRIQPGAEIDADATSVLLNRNAAKLTDVDFVFGCTDSHGSRAVLNQLCYQYLVPTIDMGVVLVPNRNDPLQIVGRSQMLAPDLGCLICGSLLDPELVRVDLLTEFERVSDPYIVGAREPAPAVISINGTIASLSVTMFLAATVGVPSTSRLLNYNGNAGTTRAARVTAHPTCYICSNEGALARATEWPHGGRETP